MTTAYFDCSSGISGDMCLGALLHAGIDFEHFKNTLSLISLNGFDITSRLVKKKGIAATKVDVTYQKKQPHRHLNDILSLINSSALSSEIKGSACSIFRRLAQAEAEVHGVSMDQIHFHEVGAVDALVDIIGTVICLSLLKVDKVVSSPLPMGRGFVRCVHGLIPLPAPAVQQLVKDIPVYGVDIEGELVTPTGAAIITTLADSFGPLPPMVISNLGLGAGEKDYDIPNILRVSIGSETSTQNRKIEDEVVIIETCIDDMNPEFFSHIWEEIFAAGALDMFLTPVVMKKGRPGTLATVSCREPDTEKVLSVLIRETSTIGIRFRLEKRFCCPRKIVYVQTSFGTVRVKQSHFQGRTNVAPEYEDCRALAQKNAVPLKEVYLSALAAAYNLDHQNHWSGGE